MGNNAWWCKFHIVNDPSNDYDLCLEVLENFFHHSREVAVNLMKDVSQNGTAEIGSFSPDVAVQKYTDIQEFVNTRILQTGRIAGMVIQLNTETKPLTSTPS